LDAGQKAIPFYEKKRARPKKGALPLHAPEKKKKKNEKAK